MIDVPLIDAFRKVQSDGHHSPDQVVCDPELRRRFLEYVHEQCPLGERDCLMGLLNLRKRGLLRASQR